jgi:hypothetical protein
MGFLLLPKGLTVGSELSSGQEVIYRNHQYVGSGAVSLFDDQNTKIII